MGWQYETRDPSVSLTANLTRKFTFEKTTRRSEALDCAVVNLRVAYLAVAVTVKETGSFSVHAEVCQLDYRPNDPFDLGIKAYPETAGPVFYDCPARILDQLSDTHDPLAADWRRKCRENIERRKQAPPLTAGSYLILDSPLRFTDGSEHAKFYIRDARRRIFTRHPHGLQAFKLPSKGELSRIGYRIEPLPAPLRDRHTR